ncbi:hypothetical protein [Nonomuraea sp. SYSU D8015]|uniref:hypothetical protein n=1 Tax=Nonomuraea sp. SYSU D8015 TaxID=2593644 RepID=UPI001660E83B|nr:hypothetical protein [Nonomuraea sp. SYSU D8015]
MHYDGSRWRQADPPPEVADLTEEHTAHIAASAADNVWLLQTRKSPGSLTFRWDGSRWQKIPHEVGTDEQISDLEVFGPDDVWAVDGGRFARHWDGRSWNKVPLPADAYALGGTGPDDV